MQDAINRFEQRLSLAKTELENLAQNVDLRLYSDDEDGDKSECQEEMDEDGRPFSRDKRQLSASKKAKNKFTASLEDGLKPESAKEPETLDKETEELFFKIERRHGMSSSSAEIKLAAQRVLHGEALVFVKANVGSNHHLLYDAMAMSGKKVGVLFLTPALEPAMQKVFMKNVQAVSLDSLAAADLDVLFVEQCEAAEDLAPPDLAKLRDALRQKACAKVMVSGFMTYRAFSKLKELIQKPFPGYQLPSLNVSGS